MIQPGVQLPLADRNLPAASAFDVFLQLFEVVDTIVGDTDGLSLACFLSFNQCAPRSKPGFFTAIRGMKKDSSSH